jgi:hypothetical protein
VAPKAVVVKIACQPAVAVAKEMAVDGQVERENHPAEGAAMHPLAQAKVSLVLVWPNNFVEMGRPQATLVSSLFAFVAAAAPRINP